MYVYTVINWKQAYNKNLHKTFQFKVLLIGDLLEKNVSEACAWQINPTLKLNNTTILQLFKKK